MDCPRCAAPMLERTLDWGRIDHCGTCRGLWFDRGEVIAFRDALLRRTDGGPGLSAEFDGGGDPIEDRCPRCGPATPLHEGEVMGLEVAGCERCGGTMWSWSSLEALRNRWQRLAAVRAGVPDGADRPLSDNPVFLLWCALLSS